MQKDRKRMFMQRFDKYLIPSCNFYFILLYIPTLTSSEGKVLTHTNELFETIPLQLNPSNNYYTTGDDNILFIKISSNKVLLLDCTCHINRIIFRIMK